MTEDYSIDSNKVLPQIEKLLEGARHLRNVLEIEGGSVDASSAANAAVNAIIRLREAVEEKP